MNRPQEIKTVGVVGAGAMGIGIVQVALSAGKKVLLFDQNALQVEKSVEKLKAQLLRLEEKSKISSSERISMLERLGIATKLEEFSSCDLVIEAIIEDRKIKKDLFINLEQIVSSDCVLATNTSSISITSLSSGLKNPERFVGIHFFNPAPLMPLVEVIPGLLTLESLPNEISKMLTLWGKEPVIARDLPGFIVNRIARPFYGEALRLVEENLAEPEEIDEVMRTKGFRMGPFELMDLIGIDVNFAVTKTVYEDYFFDPRYRPSLLQQRMSEAGLLGRKTGKGFYNYTDGNASSKEIKITESKRKDIFLRILSMLVNEALEAKRLKIATEEDIEKAMLKGVNYPKGLISWGQEVGYNVIATCLANLYDRYQEDRYRSSPLLKDLIENKQDHG